jgi:hypothetical protein
MRACVHVCVCVWSNNIFSKITLPQTVRYTSTIISCFITTVIRECSQICEDEMTKGGLACNVNLGPISMSRRADWVEAMLPLEDNF